MKNKILKNKYKKKKYIKKKFNNKKKYIKKNFNNKKKKIKFTKKKYTHKKKNIFFKKKNIYIKKKKKQKTILLKNNNEISEIAKQIGIKKNILIKKMKETNIKIKNFNKIKKNIAKKIIQYLGYKTKIEKENYLEKKIFIKNNNNNNNTYIRPPIITIMGHVNHGKTSLIDYIKSTKIIKKEKGNITQYINAYYINNKWGKMTLLDTPGHSIFTNMRSRGVDITDIIILLISIDDGLMPQTIEIINYVKKHKVPIIIGINKIDKKNYLNNIEILKKKLSKYNIICKKWGGKNTFTKISTKFGTGIKKLIKNIYKQSKKINLNTNINNPSTGIIIESSIDTKKGPIANIIIKDGKLKKGDIIVCDKEYGKIKSIYTDEGKKINYALPSMPVTILGLSGIFSLGNKFYTVKNKKIAKKIIKFKKKKYILNTQKNNKNKKINFTKKKKINLIIKTDVYGSMDTIIKTINEKFSKKINLISYSVGEINTNDIILSNTSKSTILSFNTKINNYAKKKINKYKIKIYSYNIIYKLIKKINNLIEKKINKKIKKKNKNISIVKNIFKSSKSNLIIIGCIVKKGTLNINNKIKIIRNKNIIYEGKIKSIQIFKKKVNIVKKNTECGICINKPIKINIGDIIKSINKNE